MPYKDPEKKKAYMKEYQQKNKDKIKEYREKNKDKLKEYNKEYYQTPAGKKLSRIGNWKFKGVIHQMPLRTYTRMILLVLHRTKTRPDRC